MALIPCRNCGKQVREQDPKCWNCGGTAGAASSGRAGGGSGSSASRDATSTTNPVPFLLVLGVVAVIMVLMSDQSSKPTYETTNEQVSTAPAGESGLTIPVPSDPGSTYTLIASAQQPDGRHRAMTRRDGRSGTSYAVREFDCGRRTFRYLADADTRAELLAGKMTGGPMTELVPGSISSQVADFVCDQ